MIGSRTRHSLSQLLELFDPGFVMTLLNKYDVRASLRHNDFLSDIANVLRDADVGQLLEILSEIARTSGDLRSRVEPKYRWNERFHDLTQCLALDGYLLREHRLVQTDPTLADAAPIDDDLIKALEESGTPRCREVIQKIYDSASAFRAVPPDYNASLVNARVALETLASDIAVEVAVQCGEAINTSKWGEVLQYLRSKGDVTIEEEHGLAGVFRFLSPGAHRPVGIPEGQMARLGRAFALNMCWFLLQNHLAHRRSLL